MPAYSAHLDSTAQGQTRYLQAHSRPQEMSRRRSAPSAKPSIHRGVEWPQHYTAPLGMSVAPFAPADSTSASKALPAGCIAADTAAGSAAHTDRDPEMDTQGTAVAAKGAQDTGIQAGRRDIAVADSEAERDKQVAAEQEIGWAAVVGRPTGPAAAGRSRHHSGGWPDLEGACGRPCDPFCRKVSALAVAFRACITLTRGQAHARFC